MVDDTDPAATGFALQGQFTLALEEVRERWQAPIREAMTGYFDFSRKLVV